MDGLEVYDRLQSMDETLNLFNLGYLSIELRALAERLYWAFGRKLQRLAGSFRLFREQRGAPDALLEHIRCYFRFSPPVTSLYQPG